jgi:hypothetical protein
LERRVDCEVASLRPTQQATEPGDRTTCSVTAPCARLRTDPNSAQRKGHPAESGLAAHCARPMPTARWPRWRLQIQGCHRRCRPATWTRAVPLWRNTPTGRGILPQLARAAVSKEGRIWARRRSGDRAANGEAPSASDAALRVRIPRAFPCESAGLARERGGDWAARGCELCSLEHMPKLQNLAGAAAPRRLPRSKPQSPSTLGARIVDPAAVQQRRYSSRPVQLPKDDVWCLAACLST